MREYKIKILKQEINKLFNELFDFDLIETKFEFFKMLLKKIFKNLKHNSVYIEKYNDFFMFMVNKESSRNMNYEPIFNYIFQYSIKEDLELLIKHKFKNKKFSQVS